MKLPYLIPAIAVLLAACNDDAGIVASPAGVEGTYQLVEINGQPLPFDERGCCIFTAGSLEFELSRYEISVTFQNKNNGRRWVDRLEGGDSP